MLRARHLVPLAGWLGLAAAWEHFDTTCSLPIATTNYVSVPDARGSLNVLWASVFTILACVWTVQQSNIPEQRQGRDGGWRGDLRWLLRSLGRRAQSLLLTLWLPELILWKALTDRVAVDRDLEAFQRFAYDDDRTWTQTHSLFANMGGFVIRCGKEAGLRDVQVIHGSRRRTVKVSNPFHLTASDILYLRREGHLERLPAVTEAELLDKSKSNGFTHMIAGLQLTWLAAQLIVRAYRRLTIAQLELTAIAYGLYAILIHACNWTRPQHPRVPITISEYEGDVPRTLIVSVLENPRTEAAVSLLGFFAARPPPPRARFGTPPPDGRLVHPVRLPSLPLGLTALWGLPWGLFAVLAAQFPFPSRPERVLWLVAAAYALVAPLAMTYLYHALWVDEKGDGILRLRDARPPAPLRLVRLLLLLYLLARSYVLLESFCTLFYLPPSAYVATVVTSFPHVS